MDNMDKAKVKLTPQVKRHGQKYLGVVTSAYYNSYEDAARAANAMFGIIYDTLTHLQEEQQNEKEATETSDTIHSGNQQDAGQD